MLALDPPACYSTVNPAPAAVASTPSVTAATDIAATVAPSGQFSVHDGKIYDPSGDQFTAKGINVFPGQVDAATILQTFPDGNAIRLAATPQTDSAQIDALVQGLTSKGWVVEIEDHTSSGAAGGDNVDTGAALQAETQWFAGLAAKYEANPRVWFGTANEPDNPSDLGSIAQQEIATYNAIRATGNTSMVMLEERGGYTSDFAQSYAADYAKMTNVAWDTHFYGWVPGYSTDPTAIFKGYTSQIANAQAIRSADGTVPVVVGEYGPSTTGLGGTDPNGTQVVQMVDDSKVSSFAWAWNAGSDALTSGYNALTAFGQQVASYFAK